MAIKNFKAINDYVSGRKAAPEVVDGTIALMKIKQKIASDESPASGSNAWVVGVLPAGHVPALPMLIKTSGLGDSCSIAIGLADANGMSGETEDGGGPWSGSPVDISIGVLSQVPNLGYLFDVEPVDRDRNIAIMFVAGGSAEGDLEITIPITSA